LLLTLNVFALLTAYYLLKTAREPLILLHGGAEVKSYAAAGQAALLLLVVKLYAALASRVGRLKLLTTLYVFSAANLLVFAALARSGTAIGVPFYLWVGVFNSTAIAQFWAFSADIFSPEQGRRLFAVLGIGSSTGAVAGARIARSLATLGPAAMMLGAALILLGCVGLFAVVDGLNRTRTAQASADAERPLSTQGPFQLFLHDRYLQLIAALTLVLNCCNSNGEYILDRALLASAGAQGPGAEAFVASFKGDYFAWVNAAGVCLQLFAVSRVLTRFGVRRTLTVLPVVALVGYGAVAAIPVLGLIRMAKVAENSLDYSLQNTAGQALYLVATRPEKYLGKTFIDGFIVRMGDVVSALVVLLGAAFGMQIRGFAWVNLGLVCVWLALVAAVGAEHARRSRRVTTPPGALGTVPAI
jgi:AAA family ATP:ADP antiporter